MVYVFKPSSRQVDDMANIARDLTAYAGRTIAVSHIYQAIAERTLAEYIKLGPKLFYAQIEGYLKR